jgi:hypothetical protein
VAVRGVLADSPSLAREAAPQIATTYAQARENAIGETGLPEALFPRTCPFTIDRVLSDDFWPE